jgi:trans-aconitate 2-methyltransferase
MWDPSQYLRYADLRLRPAIDLLTRVDLQSPGRIVDLGCGVGNVTKMIAKRWPKAELTGVDSSPEMLNRAREFPDDINWVQADIETWSPTEPLDLVFSNAALHFVDDKHEHLLPKLLEFVTPGGVLAIQMPRNFGEPSHTLMYAAAREGPWRKQLELLLRPVPIAEPEAYHDILAPHVGSLDIWETVYLQVLEGDDPVAEWTGATWGKPLLDALNDEDRRAFKAGYVARLRTMYPRRSDGTTLFPFRRLFIVATR